MFSFVDKGVKVLARCIIFIPHISVMVVEFWLVCVCAMPTHNPWSRLVAIGQEGC